MITTKNIAAHLRDIADAMEEGISLAEALNRVTDIVIAISKLRVIRGETK